MSFYHLKIGYTESLDYTELPGYETLTEAQRQKVKDAYSVAFVETSKAMGQKIALGKAHETAKLALAEQLKIAEMKPEETVPPSIFAGLDNCT